MPLEKTPLVWSETTVDGVTERKPILRPCPDGYVLASYCVEDYPDIQHPADDDHPEPWTEPDPRPKLAWYDYQPIPKAPAITMEDRMAEQSQLLAEGRARLGEAADQGEDTASLAAYCKAVRGALAKVTDPAKVKWPAKPWEPKP